MDNSYRCDLNIWGSGGTLFTGRILTAPDGFQTTVVIKNAEGEQTFTLPADDTFMKSIEFFGECLNDEKIRYSNYETIRNQSKLMEKFERN